MISQSQEVPDGPVVKLVLALDGTATVNNRRVQLGPGDPHAELMRIATVYAQTVGRPIRVEATTPRGTWHLVAHPDGEVSTLRGPDPDARASRTVTPPAPTSPPAASQSTPPGRAQEAVEHRDATSATPIADQNADQNAVAPLQGRGHDTAAPAGRPQPGWAGAAPAPLSAPVQARVQASVQAGVPAKDCLLGQDASPSGPGLLTTGQRPVQPVRPAAGPPAARRRLPLGAITGSTFGIAVLVVAALVIVSGQSSPPDATPRTESAAPRQPSSPPSPLDTPVRSTPSSATAPAPPAPPTPVPSPLGPAAAAPGFRTTPVWAYPVAGGAQLDVGDSGQVVARTPTGQVMAISASTGRVQWWTSQAYTPDWAGPRLTRIDGQSVVAMVRPDQLAYWRVPTPTVPTPTVPTPTESPPTESPPTEQVTPTVTTVPLPIDAVVTFTGTSPLVVLGPATAAVVHTGRLQLVPLPPGTRPLAADGGDVLAVQATGWLRARAGAIPQTHPVTPPAGVTGAPARIEAVGARFLLAAWPAKNKVQTVSLLHASTGQTAVSARLPVGVDITRGRTIRQLGGLITGVGALVVDTDAKLMRGLLPQYEITGLVHGHIYALDTTTGRTVDIRAANGQWDVKPLPAGASIPLATITPADGPASLALTVTSTDHEWLLEALPAPGRGSSSS